MIETKEATIDGHTFAVTQLPATRAVKLLHHILSAVGPAMGYAVPGGSLDVEALLKSQINFGMAIQTLFDRLSGDELVRTIKDLLHASTMDGAPLTNIDNAFAGKLSTLFKVCKFALETNYGDFTGVLGPAIALARATMAKNLTAKTTSSGPSGSPLSAVS